MVFVSEFETGNGNGMVLVGEFQSADGILMVLFCGF